MPFTQTFTYVALTASASPSVMVEAADGTQLIARTQTGVSQVGATNVYIYAASLDDARQGQLGRVVWDEGTVGESSAESVLFQADTATLASAIQTRVLQALPDAQPGTASGLPRQSAITALNDPDAAAIAAEIEAALVNDGDATAFLQTVADKIAADLSASDVTAQAIASATRDALVAVASTFRATGFAVPGDAMTLTAAYDAAMTAAQPGDSMVAAGQGAADAAAARSAAESVVSKLPADDRRMAGAGTTATNLDEVTAGGGGFPPEQAAKLDTLLVRTSAGVSVTIQSPVLTDGSISPLVQGDAYLSEDGRAFSWTFEQHGYDLTDAAFKFGLKSRVDGTVITIDASHEAIGLDVVITAELTSAESSSLPAGGVEWEVQIVLAGTPGSRPVTPLRGQTSVLAQIVQ